MRGTVTARRLSMELRDPTTQARAISEIIKAFRTSKGNATHAAEALNVSHQALMRWVHDVPELEAEVRKVRERHGAMHFVGSEAYSKAKPAPRRRASRRSST